MAWFRIPYPSFVLRPPSKTRLAGKPQATLLSSEGISLKDAVFARGLEIGFRVGQIQPGPPRRAERTGVGIAKTEGIGGCGADGWVGARAGPVRRVHHFHSYSSRLRSVADGNWRRAYLQRSFLPHRRFLNVVVSSQFIISNSGLPGQRGH